jgi:hypothetical protein
MWKKIQDRIFPFIIALSALSVSASAAFYSQLAALANSLLEHRSK